MPIHCAPSSIVIQLISLSTIVWSSSFVMMICGLCCSSSWDNLSGPKHWQIIVIGSKLTYLGFFLRHLGTRMVVKNKMGGINFRTYSIYFFWFCKRKLRLLFFVWLLFLRNCDGLNCDFDRRSIVFCWRGEIDVLCNKFEKFYSLRIMWW